MLDKLGTLGLVGIVVTLGGLGLVASQAPLVAAGLLLVLAGIGLVTQSLVRNVMSAFGLA
jgi:hypothetical protein